MDKKYDLNEVVDTLQESATEALKDGRTSEWGHRTLQIVEWLKDYMIVKTSLKKGHWIYPNIPPQYIDGQKCSECGYNQYGEKTNYCPDCGAEMDGEEKESD